MAYYGSDIKREKGIIAFLGRFLIMTVDYYITVV